MMFPPTDCVTEASAIQLEVFSAIVDRCRQMEQEGRLVIDQTGSTLADFIAREAFRTFVSRVR